ncbi:MAG: hypothetical protein HFG58_09065 [Lachnospiraceae bacterium]|nr:hypothetical protein [Lachnospiraceae bacterium]
MIEYDFSQLIQDQAFVNISLVEKIANSLPNSLNEDTFIDTIWEKMEALVCSESPDIDSDIAASLKEDVLMSLYVSAKYTTMEEQKFSIIDDALKDIHTTATKEDSLDSIKKGLHSLRKEIRESFHVGGNVLTFGQLFERNPLLYFQAFWNDEENNTIKFKCFNLDDYIKYLKANSSWPFTPKNYNGMHFFNYFSGIHKIIEKDKDISDKQCLDKWDFYSDNTDSPDFEDFLSAYILEELFSPVSFIQNVHLHISTFESIFSDYEKPYREMSMILMEPLFKLPKPLWEKLSGSYISALKNYIDHLSDISMLTILGASMYTAIYHNQYTFPYLKILVANVLFKKIASINDIASTLEEYIKKNIEKFDYFTPLKKSMYDLADYRYPTKAIRPYDIEGYKKLHPDLQTKGNDKKRNNNSIETYEINFTYNFFCFPDSQKFRKTFLSQQQPQRIDSPVTINFLLEIPALQGTYFPFVNQQFITMNHSIEVYYPITINRFQTISPPFVIQAPFTIQLSFSNTTIYITSTCFYTRTYYNIIFFYTTAFYHTTALYYTTAFYHTINI